MIKRVLLFKIKVGTPQTEVEELLRVLGTYPTELPGVLNWSLGQNLSGDQSFDYALVCDFDSRPDLDGYMMHPYHRETAGEYYRPIVERSASIYYEF
ncbi:MAG: Dabb family protein [Dehalococcoidia bacterium]